MAEMPRVVALLPGTVTLPAGPIVSVSSPFRFNGLGGLVGPRVSVNGPLMVVVSARAAWSNESAIAHRAADLTAFEVALLRLASLLATIDIDDNMTLIASSIKSIPAVPLPLADRFSNCPRHMLYGAAPSN